MNSEQNTGFISSRRSFMQRLVLMSGAVVTMPLGTAISYAADKEEEKLIGSGNWATQYGPYLQQPTITSIKILWTTKSPGIAWVEYWPVESPRHRQFKEDSQFGLRRVRTTKHIVTLEDLKPGTKYAYKVYTRKPTDQFFVNPNHNDEKPDGTFTMLDPRCEKSSFLIINDLHCPFDGQKGRIRHLMEKGKASERTLIFHNGDLLDYFPGSYFMPKQDDPIYVGALQPVKDIVSNVPFILIRGNHEYRGHATVEVEETFPPFEETRAFYGMIHQGQVCFILLDSGEDRKDEGGVTDWEKYFTKQVLWLKKAVKTQEFKKAPFRVAMIHIPPMRDAIQSGWSDEEIENHHYSERRILNEIVPVLSDAGINIMLSGHTHSDEFRPIKSQPDLNFPLLINGQTSYITIEVERQKMTVVQTRDEKSQIICTLEFSPNKFTSYIHNGKIF